MAQNILLLGNISQTAEDIFKQAGHTINRVEDPTDIEKVSDALASADVVCGRTNMKLTKELIESAENLKAIAVFSVNTSGIDLETATNRKIPVFNAAGLNAASVVELTIGLILSILRKIPQQDARLKNKVWQKSAEKDNAHEASGKTLGIIGMGDIGRKVAKVAVSLGMKIIFFDPFVEENSDESFKKAALEELLETSDIVTVHAASEEKIIGEEEIEMMQDGSYIINMARKHTVNAAAVVAGLKTGKLAGAAIDIHENETNPFESVFLDPKIKDKIVMTNHSGGETKESRQRVAIKMAQMIIDYFEK